MNNMQIGIRAWPEVCIGRFPDQRGQTLSAYEICARTKGKAVADKKYREFYPREKAEVPLEVFEADDTDSGVFLIDDKSGLPCGRGYLTGVVDQHTDLLMGADTLAIMSGRESLTMDDLERGYVMFLQGATPSDNPFSADATLRLLDHEGEPFHEWLADGYE